MRKKRSGPGSTGSKIRGRASALAALSWLWACDPISNLAPDTAALTASAPGGVPAAPDCASCHAHQLSDALHQYHLASATVNRDNLARPGLNNVTTCMDCHFNSIRSFSFTRSDTIWGNSNGQKILRPASPEDKILTISNSRMWRPLPQMPADTGRGWLLAEEIDSLIFRYARIGEMVQWRTGPAHQDGGGDVAFAPNDLETPGSSATAYRARDLSCSAIACHASPSITYRFMSPAKGFSNCPSLSGNDPTCNETTVPTGKRAAL
jgi:hypothetical protein